MGGNNQYPTIQIISTEINVQKFKDDEFYYDKKEKEIEKEVKKDADIVILDLKTDQKIKELWVMELLIYLQRKFSKIVIIPNTNIPNNDLNDWFKIVRPREILKSC